MFHNLLSKGLDKYQKQMYEKNAKTCLPRDHSAFRCCL